MADRKAYYVEVVDGIETISKWVGESTMRRYRKIYGGAFRIVRTN